MTLLEQQRLFWTAVRGEAVGDDVLNEVFMPSETMEAPARLDIYRGMYWYRQQEALKECFPAVARGLGEDFPRVVRGYLNSHPSRSPQLERVGEWLEQHLRASAAHAQWADLAALEWARMQAFLSPPERDVARASDVRPETFAASRLSFIDGLFLLTLNTEACAAWRESEMEGMRPSPPAHRATPQRVAVWRKGFRVSHRALTDPDEATALERAKQGATLAECCEVFSHRVDGAEAAFTVLRNWFEAEWVRAMVLPREG